MTKKLTKNDSMSKNELQICDEKNDDLILSMTYSRML